MENSSSSSSSSSSASCCAGANCPMEEQQQQQQPQMMEISSSQAQQQQLPQSNAAVANNSHQHGHSQQQHHSHSHNSSHHSTSNSLSRVRSLDTCRVCGDGPARMHYGVPTCFGCKGFFRRTLKRTKEYTCRYSGNCIVDRYERNSCRFCRFKRCLEVGMDPKAVRPDRDAAGRTHPVRRRMSRGNISGIASSSTTGDAQDLPPADAPSSSSSAIGCGTDEWVRKLPVEMRTLLMQIMNIEALVHHGDTHECAKNLYPLPFQSMRHMFEDPSCLDGKRTEIRYEPYRQVEPEELTYLAHRRLIATVDTIDHLCALMDLHNTRDKIIIAKAAYAPLTLFCAVAATARVTRNRDILCLCNYGYVPRGAHLSYAEPYHFANRLVDRALDELVEPFHTFNFKEQEIVLMKAIVALNPYLPTLSTEAAEQVADFRDRLQETLYNVVRESHPKEVASSRFGNLLLFLPNIMILVVMDVMILASIMMENLQFIQSFRHQDIGPLLGELLEDADEAEPGAQDNGGGLISGSSSMAIDDVFSHSGSENELSMRHSQSSNSINSMTSGGLAALSGQSQQQQCSQSSDNLHGMMISNTSFSSSASFQPQLQQYSAPNLSSMPDLVVCQQQKQQQFIADVAPVDSRSRQLHQQPQMSSNDSDPDYNITLTAESLRQAIQHQQMEVDSPPMEQHQNQPQYQPHGQTATIGTTMSSPPVLVPSQKPHFFIDPCFGAATINQPPPMPMNQQHQSQQQQQTMKTMVAASKHVFTVEKSLALPPCCHHQVSSNLDDKCQNGDCPTALAVIFPQQRQQQKQGIQMAVNQQQQCCNFEADNEDSGIFFLGTQQGQQQHDNNNKNTAINPSSSSTMLAMSKSQSFPYFDATADCIGGNSAAGGGNGNGNGMPSSVSHDNFHQH